MNITIWGSGAIGAISGIYMAQGGADVTFVDVVPEHVQAIRTTGFKVDGCRGDFSLPPQKAFTPDELVQHGTPLEAVILATKIQHTEAAVRFIAPLLAPDGFVVSLQNGFNEELIASIVGADRTVGALPDYGGAYIDPGHIEYVHEGPVYVGELSGKVTPRVEELKRLFSMNTECRIADDIYARTWAKAVYSSQIITSSLVNAPGYEVLADKRTKRVAGACVREVLQLSMVMGVKIPDGDFFEPRLYLPQTSEDTQKLFGWIDGVIEKLHHNRKENKDPHVYVKKASGIHWDIIYRKRPSEVGTEGAYIMDKAGEYHCALPLNTRLFNMILEIERGEREMGWHNIDEMMHLVDALGLQLP